MGKPVVNTFSSYLNTDNHLEASNNQSYRYAKNVIADDENQNTFISNEHSNKKLHTYSAPIVGKKYIAKLNATVILLSTSEIHLFDHNTNTSKFVAKDSEFNCQWNFSQCEWINVYDYEEYICDTWIIYSSNKIYYNINLSELLDPKRKQGLIQSLSTTCGSGCSQKTCEYFKVFKKVCNPHIETIVLDGGNLRNGTYFISGRYSNQMSGTSNPFPLTNAIHIGGENNMAGELSNKRIEVTFQNISCTFDQIELFVHEIVDGISVTKKLPSKYIDSSSFTVQYTGNEGIEVDTAELLINWRTYLEGEELLLHKNRAIYYRLTPQFDYNFQPIANQIETYWYAVKVPLTDIKRYNLKSFMRDETYAFSFYPNMKDGRKGYGFHIPAVNNGDCAQSTIKSNASSSIDLNEVLTEDGSDVLSSLTGNASKFNLTNINNIPLPGTSNSPDTNKDTGTLDSSAAGSLASSKGVLLKRVRDLMESTVENPTEQNFINNTAPIIESWVGEIDDICKAIEAGCGDIFGNALNEDGSVNCDCGDAIDAYCERERRKQQAEICRQDHLKAEEISATWFSTLSDYIDESKQAATSEEFSKSDPNKKQGSGRANILTNAATLVPKLSIAANNIIENVKKRERSYTTYTPYSFTKNVSYTSDSVDNAQAFNTSSAPVTSLFGNTFKQIKFEDTPSFPSTVSIEVEKGVYKNYPIVKRGRTKPKTEKSTYPCTTDCNGNPIYCGLSGANITHHTMPSNTEVPFWIPKSYGDGSTIASDSDIMDGYGVLLGIEFTNVQLDPYLKENLCLESPYGFGVVKRDSRTSSVLLKGPASQSYVSSNQGKRYLYEKDGSNSFERCSRYIDRDGSRMDPGATTNTDNIFIYSIDQLVKKPYLNATHVIKQGLFSGAGARHMLYDVGVEVSDDRANRQDQRGSVHTINMSTFSPSNTKVEIASQIYTEPNAVISPPSGNDLPYMGKYRQESLWVSAPGISTPIDDTSFVGDVLQQVAPIDDSKMEYFCVFKELEDQYGDIASLNYVPILQARGFEDVTRGLVGDSYIGVHTIIKTSFISEKVGNYFPVGNMVAGKADRCICDDPEDAIHSKTGQYNWKFLPKEGDAADAKNWAGLHTTTITKTWEQAKSTKVTESDYYFPKVTKHAISYVGESDANPWLRTRGETLSEQVYDNLKAKYTKHSKDLSGGNWIDGYLNQFYVLHEQEAPAKLRVKAAILAFINFMLPVLGIGDVLSPETGIEAAGGILNFVINAALFILISQVLYTTEFVDRFLRLTPCKKDNEGGEEAKIEKFFINYPAYNYDYLQDYAFATIVGVPLSYTGCICSDNTISSIYVSDKNFVETYINGYQIVRPNNMINLQESNGKLTKVYELNDKLFLHTTNGVYTTRIVDDIPDTIQELLEGSINIAPEPQLITTANEEGSYGLINANHGKLTAYGFIFVDYRAKDLILFDGSKFEVLSSPKYGNSKLFKNYIKFCTHTACNNEQVDGTNYFTFGIDHRFNRLLFTKSDGDYSFTISFSFVFNRWVSFHSYIPQEYISNRYDMYSIKDNSIWIHNDFKTFGNYYDKQYNCILDLVTSNGDYRDFKYLSTSIHSEAKNGNKREFKKTFDKVWVNNSYQGTGELVLNLYDNTSPLKSNLKELNSDHTNIIPCKMVRSYFNFNELHNYIIGDVPVVYNDNCKIEPIIANNTTYTDRSKTSFDNRVIEDNYLYYRFILDNTDGTKLYIKRIITEINET